jgi:hypothetical protein
VTTVAATGESPANGCATSKKDIAVETCARVDNIWETHALKRRIPFTHVDLASIPSPRRATKAKPVIHARASTRCCRRSSAAALKSSGLRLVLPHLQQHVLAVHTGADGARQHVLAFLHLAESHQLRPKQHHDLGRRLAAGYARIHALESLVQESKRLRTQLFQGGMPGKAASAVTVARGTFSESFSRPHPFGQCEVVLQSQDAEDVSANTGRQQLWIAYLRSQVDAAALAKVES